MANLKSNTEEPKFKTYSELFDYKNSLKVPSPFISSKYDYGASYETYLTDLDNYRNQQQGFWDTMGQGATRFLLATGQKVAQGAAFVGGAIYGALNDEIGVMDTAINNSYSKVLRDYTELIDTEYPIYKGSDYEDLSAFELLGDSRWWATQGADMAAFVASMALSAKGLDKLGLFRGVGAATGQIGKITGNLLGNAQKGYRIGQGLGYYGSATITNSAIEGFFEASEVYNNNFKNYQELLNLSPKEAKAKALEDATSSWKWNQAILLPSSLYEMKLLLGGASSLGKGALRYFNNTTDEIIKPSFRQYAKNIGVNIGKGIVAEGIWEENIQLAVQKHLENITAPTSTFLESSAEVLGNYINNFTTKEGQESILGGAVLGALMGGGGAYINTKKEYKDALDRYSKIQQSGTFSQATEDLNKINNLNTSNLTYIENTPETINESGQIVPSVSVPKINKKELIKKLNDLSLNIQNDKIAQIIDTMPDSSDIKEFLTDSLLANVVASYSSQGLGSLLLNKFNNEQISEEDRSIFGLYDTQNTTAEQTIQNNKNKVKDLIKKFDKISDIYRSIPNIDINHIFRLSVAKDNLDNIIKDLEINLSKEATNFYTSALNENNPKVSNITKNYIGTTNDQFRKDVFDYLTTKDKTPEIQDYFNKYSKLEFLKKLQNEYSKKLNIYTNPKTVPIAYQVESIRNQELQNSNINTIINQNAIESEEGDASIIPILDKVTENTPITVKTNNNKTYNIIGPPTKNAEGKIVVETDTGEFIPVNNIVDILKTEEKSPIVIKSKEEEEEENITNTDNTLSKKDEKELKEIQDSGLKKTTILTTSISDETGDKDISTPLKLLSKKYKERLNSQITQLELAEDKDIFIMFFPIWKDFNKKELTSEAEKYLDAYNKELSETFKTKDAIYGVVMVKDGNNYKPIITDKDGNILENETEDSYYIVTSVNRGSNVENLAEIPLIMQYFLYSKEDLLEMEQQDSNTFKYLLKESRAKETEKINTLRNSIINNYNKNIINYHKIESFSKGHNNAESEIDLINNNNGVVERKEDIQSLIIPTNKKSKPKETLVGKLYAIIRKDRRYVRVIQPTLGNLEGKVDLVMTLFSMYFNGQNNIKSDTDDNYTIFSKDNKKPGLLNSLIFFKKADENYLLKHQIYIENNIVYYGLNPSTSKPFQIDKNNFDKENKDFRYFLVSKFLQLSPNLLDSKSEKYYDPISIQNNILTTKQHNNYQSYLLTLNLKAIEPSFNEVARVNKYFTYNEEKSEISLQNNKEEVLQSNIPTASVSDIEAKKADIERRRQEELKANENTIRVKVETYNTLDINDNPVQVEITTNADGSRVLKARLINEDGSVEPMAYSSERIDNKGQLSLTNEKLVELYIGNEGNTLKKVSENLNPSDARTNKINAKYDAELAALKQAEPNKTFEQKIEETVKNAQLTISFDEKISPTIDTVVQDDDIKLDEFIEGETINFVDLEKKYPNLTTNNIYNQIKRKINNKKNIIIEKQIQMLKKSFC